MLIDGKEISGEIRIPFIIVCEFFICVLLNQLYQTFSSTKSAKEDYT